MWAFANAKNGMHNLWRSTQQAIWLAPNNLLAWWKVAKTELWFLRWFGRIEIGFAVTKKGSGSGAASRWRRFRDTAWCVWPFVVYYAGVLAAFVFVMVRATRGVRWCLLGVA